MQKLFKKRVSIAMVTFAMRVIFPLQASFGNFAHAAAGWSGLFGQLVGGGAALAEVGLLKVGCGWLLGTKWA